MGLANPPACARTLAAILSAERLGLPEGRIPLADAVIELCLSPKSNSGITAIDTALADVKAGKAGDVPNHLKDAHYKGAEKLGHGVDYKYPHNYENDWVAQQYLPNKIKNTHYYQPKANGKYEVAFGDQYRRLWHAQHNTAE